MIRKPATASATGRGAWSTVWLLKWVQLRSHEPDVGRGETSLCQIVTPDKRFGALTVHMRRAP